MKTKVSRNNKLRMLRHMLRWHKLYFPATEFNLCDWGATKRVVGVQCTTVACAAGSAALWYPFNRMGFTAQVNEHTGRITPVYDYTTSWGAINRFFELNSLESHWLFSSGPGYSTRKDVIKRINAFIKHNGVPPSCDC